MAQILVTDTIANALMQLVDDSNNNVFVIETCTSRASKLKIF